MITRTLLLTALAAAFAVAPAQADVTGPACAPSATCPVVDQDLGQPDMARHLVFSGDAYDNEMGVTDKRRPAGLAAGVISYNGHAGLGASAYQHNQSDLEFLAFGSTDARAAGVTDGTSNTIFFGVRSAITMADMGGQFSS